MARRRRGRDIDGVVLLDKPVGCSSNAALQRVRRAYDARKAGHTGSLDPLASGLLPVCLGEATKVSSYLLGADKRYLVTARHGARTETGDREGAVIEESAVALPEPAAIEATLARFVGAQQQIPPMYSALKHQGKRLYEHARAGETVARAPRDITVYDIALTDVSDECFSLDVRVSSGTYIRTLVEDIARAWGGAAHVSMLHRTAIGGLGLDYPPVALDVIEARARDGGALDEWLLPISTIIANWPQARVDEAAADAITHGRAVRCAHVDPTDDVLCVVGPGGELLGLGSPDDEGRVAPRRMFARPQR